MSAAVNIERELDLARNLFGPLSRETRQRVRDVVENPTPETWDAAYTIVVGADRRMNLWQAVIRTDPSYSDISRPFSGKRPPASEIWTRVPDRAVLVEALRLATH